MDKERKKQYAAEWYAANRDKELARMAQYREANREKLRQDSLAYDQANREKRRLAALEYRKSNRAKRALYQREWRKANRERLREYASEYAKANPEVIATIVSRRRIRKAGNGGKHTTAERLAKFTALGNICYYCGCRGKLTIDHAVPISRGGGDGIENILPACFSCNSRKGALTSEEFMANQGLHR